VFGRCPRSRASRFESYGKRCGTSSSDVAYRTLRAASRLVRCMWRGRASTRVSTRHAVACATCHCTRIGGRMRVSYFYYCGFGFCRDEDIDAAGGADLALEQNPTCCSRVSISRSSGSEFWLPGIHLSPKVIGGSGLAWSPGYPTTIDGNLRRFRSATVCRCSTVSQSIKCAGQGRIARSATT